VQTTSDHIAPDPTQTRPLTSTGDGLVGPEPTAPGAPRVAALDIVRIFATLGVIAIHVIAAAYAGIPLILRPDWVRIVPAICRFAVPAFVLLTGVLVWGRPWAAGPRGYGRFVGRRALVVLVPYLFWATLYFALNIAPTITRGGRGALLLDYLGRLIDGSAGYHLYFVPAIFVLYLVTPLASRLAARWPWLLLAGTFALSLVVKAPEAFAFPTDGAALALGARLQMLAANVAAFAPYAALGALVAVRPRVAVDRWAAAGVVLAATLGLAYTRSGLFVMPPGPLGRALEFVPAAAMLLGLLGCARWLEGAVPVAGRAAVALAPDTYGVYLVHPLVLQGLLLLPPVAYLAPALRSPLSVLLLGFVLTLATWVIIRILRAVPVLRRLV
jgi:surface polysaccharide O-acyltransferase-like enzyme